MRFLRKRGPVDYWLLERQLAVHADSVRSATIASVIASIIVIGFMWRHVSPAANALILVLGFIAYAHRFIIHRNRTRQRRIAMLRSERSVAIDAFMTGAYWGITFGIYVRLAAKVDLLLITSIAAGVIFSATLMYRAFPRAVYIFLATMTVLLGVAYIQLGFLSATLAVLALILFDGILINFIHTNHAHFRAYNLRERELTEQGEIIQMLLNEYEEQGSDWLWKISQSGELRDVSVRFAAALGQRPEDLEGTLLTDLFKPCSESRQLARFIDAGRPFRNLTLPLKSPGTQKWWMLSARPERNSSSAMLISFRGVATDVTAAKQAEAHISYLAHYDALTDLANRSLFNDMLAHALRRKARDDRIALLYLDIDHFKAINDTLGHPVGDRLLQTVARRLEDVCRDCDVVGRLGGDEFAILLSDNVTDDRLAALANDIIAALNLPIYLDGQQLLVSTSIGIAAFDEGDCDADELMQRADLALYAAKEAGRNCWRPFQPGMVEAAQLRRQLEVDLRAALGRGELVLHYQPLVNCMTRETVAYEALVRWHHPDRGVMMPDSFITIAEDCGLIVQLGEWVLRQALHDAALWPEHIKVSVNLSPAQVGSPNLVSTIVAALSAAGVAPERLELEITESVLLKKSEENKALLHELRKFGIRVCLDDFGTGYSSLNYLRSFPFDKIKIDRSFVNDLDTRKDGRAIVRAVTDLAKNLSMTTTAEGVEREEQLAQLIEEGCTEAQGYLFGRPQPLDAFPELRGGETGPLRPRARTRIKPLARMVESEGAARESADDLRIG